MNEHTIQQVTVIGRETSINGEMNMTGSAKILGQFDGRISVVGDVFVAEGAVVRADILADQIIIEGEVEGNVTARERLQLASTAQLVGDIATRALVVEDGASLLGNCHVGAEAAGRATGAQSGVTNQSAVGSSVSVASINLPKPAPSPLKKPAMATLELDLEDGFSDRISAAS
jgi:cytoskeletal protein CcmA (bactofilin family)